MDVWRRCARGTAREHPSMRPPQHARARTSPPHPAQTTWPSAVGPDHLLPRKMLRDHACAS